MYALAVACKESLRGAEESITDGHVWKLFRKAGRNFAAAQVTEHTGRRQQEAHPSCAKRQRYTMHHNKSYHGECLVCPSCSHWDWVAQRDPHAKTCHTCQQVSACSGRCGEARWCLDAFLSKDFLGCGNMGIREGLCAGDADAEC